MELKGKTLSLASKLFAVVFVLVCFVVSGLTDLEISVDDMIKVAVFIALVFSPVDVSLWIKNFFGGLHQKTTPDDGKGEEPNGE